jgi:phytoene dehydrogenase-like protein
MPAKAIIIGAGVSGLSVGCYLQMNGFDTEIFEMHNQPGGLCTAWKRGDYTFDGCIHWLMGSGPASNLHQVWRELHAVQGRRFVEWEEYMRVRLAGGGTFTIYTDPDRLEKEMLRLAPQDGKLIARFCGAMRRFSAIDMPVTTEKMGLFERLGYLLPLVRLAPAMRSWGTMNVQAFCSRLQSRELAEALGMLFGGGSSLPDFPMIGLILMLVFMHKKTSGYPIGGSLEFARAIARRYLELGGRIRYNARVERILVEQDKAVGIVSAGQEHRADEIISCADGHATLYDMLGGRDLRGQPASLVFPLEQPLVLEDGALSLKRLGVRFFSFDPTLAPEGKTSAIVMIESRNLSWWRGLRDTDPARYREEKRKVGERVVEALERELGGIKPFVEVVDVATPATWQRYTGNWQGSYEGFLPTRKTMMKSLGFTLPGLANFYMHGQWVSVGGGLPPAGASGRALARILCRKHGKKFSAAE